MATALVTSKVCMYVDVCVIYEGRQGETNPQPSDHEANAQTTQLKVQTASHVAIVVHPMNLGLANRGLLPDIPG